MKSVKQISRREALGTISAMSLASAATRIEPSIIKRHDESVARYLEAQITDPQNRWSGGIPDALGLHPPHSAAALITACATSFLQPASRYYRSPLMRERIGLAARFLERSQTPDGNIDLLITNFNSPPDTGFAVHGLGSAACLASRAGEKELVQTLQPFLVKAGGGMARGGVHTPNHRWVICQALAQINEIFPNPAYVRRIDQWLAEGIDIDEDGQYTERSTGVYNTVCDRAFVVMAAKLKRPELLDPVRRNLESMLYLLHPGYEVVTEISRRQDQYEVATMGGYWFPLQYLAVHDRNGRYATLARAFSASSSSVTALMEYPELVGEFPGSAVPEDYEKVFPALRVVRIRRGPVSATVLLDGDSHFFAFRRGDAVIQSVRFASAFFGKAQFVPEQGRRTAPGRYELSQSLDGPYYQPLDPPAIVKAGEWGRTREKRGRSEVCRLTQSAVIAETKLGFRLRLRAEGTKNVPVTVEISLRDGGRLEGCEPVRDGHILAAGHATYRRGGDTVRFGPGLREHTYTQVRGAEPPAPGTRVYLCGFTPFDHELEIG